MDNKHSSYSIPTDFNPFVSIDRLRGLVDALHHLVTEGEMTERPAPQAAYSNLVALMELLQPNAHELHDYLREIENRTTLRLPLTDEEMDAIAVDRNMVKEPTVLYGVR